MNYQKLISHRGNLDGAEKDIENTTFAIEKAINNGFDCEVDLWINEKSIYLGHDKPQYKIELSFLNEFRDKLWIHCKNFEALVYMQNINQDFNYFWHENDRFTITSKGYFWTYPDNKYSENSVIVNLDKNLILESNCFGICSDYVKHY